MGDWLDDIIVMKMSETVHNRETEESLSALQDELATLQDELLTLEANEPTDFGSNTYNRWEARKDLLETQIMDIETELTEFEDSLSS